MDTQQQMDIAKYMHIKTVTRKLGWNKLFYLYSDNDSKQGEETLTMDDLAKIGGVVDDNLTNRGGVPLLNGLPGRQKVFRRKSLMSLSNHLCASSTSSDNSNNDNAVTLNIKQLENNTQGDVDSLGLFRKNSSFENQVSTKNFNQDNMCTRYSLHSVNNKKKFHVSNSTSSEDLKEDKTRLKIKDRYQNENISENLTGSANNHTEKRMGVRSLQIIYDKTYPNRSKTQKEQVHAQNFFKAVTYYKGKYNEDQLLAVIHFIEDTMSSNFKSVIFAMASFEDKGNTECEAYLSCKRSYFEMRSLLQQVVCKSVVDIYIRYISWLYVRKFSK